MKIIHCSDLHLDSKMKSNLDSKKAKERRDEILITYQNMIQYAKSNGVKIILIAGDMFDKKNITVKARNIVLDSINSNPEIDFIYLKGNHDEANFVSDLEEIPSNLKLFNSTEWTTYKYGRITISGIELGKISDYEIYNTLMLNKNDINIVTLHGQEVKYDQKDKAEIINIGSFKNKNIDYLALGHIHKFKQERIDSRGIYCYSGCLEGRGFDECGEKGFVLLDVNEETSKITSDFVPFSGRRLYEIDVDISKTTTTLEAESKIDEAIKDIEKEALIKIVLTGKVDLNTERDINYLEKKYKNIYYFAKIYDETSLEIDYMTYENDASLKGEFIRLVLKQDLTEEDKRKIITTGIKALSGEEVN
jgi:exonuclease SbcD